MKRILFVDDVPEIRIMAADRIKQRGHQVLLCDDGKRALDMIDAGTRFDILITDQNMPLMDGSDLIVVLRARGFTQPMYVYSSVPSCVPTDCGCDGIYAKNQIEKLLDKIGD